MRKTKSMNPAESDWIATFASVTTCRYQFGSLNTLTFGFRTSANFLITFDYYAHGRLYSGEFQSPVAIPQNEQIPIRYNPLSPEQNSRSSDPVATFRSPIFAIGVAGSIILSLVWLALLRGCR